MQTSVHCIFVMPFITFTTCKLFCQMQVTDQESHQKIQSLWCVLKESNVKGNLARDTVILPWCCQNCYIGVYKNTFLQKCYGCNYEDNFYMYIFKLQCSREKFHICHSILHDIYFCTGVCHIVFVHSSMHFLVYFYIITIAQQFIIAEILVLSVFYVYKCFCYDFLQIQSYVKSLVVWRYYVALFIS